MMSEMQHCGCDGHDKSKLGREGMDGELDIPDSRAMQEVSVTWLKCLLQA